MILLTGICLAVLVLGFAVICREIENCEPQFIDAEKTKKPRKRDKRGRFCR